MVALSKIVYKNSQNYNLCFVDTQNVKSCEFVNLNNKANLNLNGKK